MAGKKNAGKCGAWYHEDEKFGCEEVVFGCRAVVRLGVFQINPFVVWHLI